METCGSEKKLHESMIMPLTPNFSDAQLPSAAPHG